MSRETRGEEGVGLRQRLAARFVRNHLCEEEERAGEGLVWIVRAKVGKRERTNKMIQSLSVSVTKAMSRIVRSKKGLFTRSCATP